MKLFNKVKKKWKRIKEKQAIKQTKDLECKQCGNCCKGFGWPTKAMAEDLKYYYSLHENVEIIEYEGKEFLYFHLPCKHLQDNGLCAIYETDDRPIICVKGYTQKREGVIFPDGCAFK